MRELMTQLAAHSGWQITDVISANAAASTEIEQDDAESADRLCKPEQSQCWASAGPVLGIHAEPL